MDKKLKIAVWHNLCSGGGKRALYHHVQGLVARGHTVEAWCPPTADQSYLPLGTMIRENVVPLAYPDYIPSNPASAIYDGYRRVVELVRAMEHHARTCAREIDQGGFDLLLANACMFFATGPISRFVSIPKALYLQEPNRKLYEAEPALPWLALPESGSPWWTPRNINARLIDYFRIQGKRLQARVESENAEAYDLILVNSFFSRESLLRSYGLESKVCYLGVDTQLFPDLGLPRDKFVIGLGSMTHGKRADRAIRAIGTIPAENRPEFIWVGNFSDDRYRDEVTALAQSCGVKLTVKIRLSDEELVEMLNRAAAMIYTPQLEPFGFAPLEASACGVPVAAIAEGGVRETLRDGVNGLLVNDDDPQALGAAIARLLQDRDLARKLVDNTRKELEEKWTWEKALDRLEGHLYRLVA